MSEQPTPDINQLWTPDEHNFFYPNAVIQATVRYNQTPYEELAAPLRETVQHDPETGIDFSLMAEVGDSIEEAILLFNPFANDLSDNMLQRADYCNTVFRHAGITDKAGKHLPVLVFSSPANKSTLSLTKEQRSQIKDGSLGPVAAEYLKVAQHRGFGRVALAGFSQGAGVVAAAGNEAYQANMDVLAVSAGDPANVVKRSRLSLLNAFNSQAKHLKPDIAKAGIDAFAEAHKDDSLVSYARAILRQTKINAALYSGLAKDHFADDILATLARHEDVAITVGFGNESPISPPEAIHEVIDKIRAEQPEGSQPVEAIEVEGGRHTWGDRVDLLARFYTYGLQRIR